MLKLLVPAPFELVDWLGVGPIEAAPAVVHYQWLWDAGARRIIAAAASADARCSLSAWSAWLEHPLVLQHLGAHAVALRRSPASLAWQFTMTPHALQLTVSKRPESAPYGGVELPIAPAGLADRTAALACTAWLDAQARGMSRIAG